LMAGIGMLTSAPEYFVVCRFIDLMALLTLNPVFQFDGYWFLADWLALPNLYRRALTYLGNLMKKPFGRSTNIRFTRSMPRHSYAIFVGYAILCNAFLAAVVWLSYQYVYSTFAKVHLIAPAMFASMVFALKTYDLGLFVNRFLALFFIIAFPATAMVGIYRYAALLVGYCLRRVARVANR
jgi:hypothetical protein